MQPIRALQLEQLVMEQYYLLNIMEDAVMKLRLTLKIMLLVTVIWTNLAQNKVGRGSNKSNNWVCR